MPTETEKLLPSADPIIPLLVHLARLSGKYEGITCFPDGLRVPFTIEGRPTPVNFMDPGWYGKEVFRFKGFKGGVAHLDLWKYICEIDGTKRSDKPKRKENSHDHRTITMEEQEVPSLPPDILDAP